MEFQRIKVRFYILLYLLLIIFCFNCSSSDGGLKLSGDKNFPKWLKDGRTRTSQTSGIIYLGTNRKYGKSFLAADDIGAIFRLTIKDNSSIKLNKVKLSDDVKNYLKPFPKKDFEEITYDKYTGEVLLSIEGNDPDFKKYVGIYKLKFKNNDLYSDEITAIEKLNITPENKFLEYTANNIGFEGLAVDNKYIYAGLETTSPTPIFSEKTKLYIIDKLSKEIVKVIDTEELKIVTISGLFCPKDHTLLGIDRNAKKIFVLEFDNNLNIITHSNLPVKTSIPGYPGLEYGSSLESITMDSDNNVYLVDDPWKPNFIPPEEIFSQLDGDTKNNFLNLVPIIFKFNLNLQSKR